MRLDLLVLANSLFERCLGNSVWGWSAACWLYLGTYWLGCILADRWGKTRTVWTQGRVRHPNDSLPWLKTTV